MGATSRSPPPSRSGAVPAPQRITGTGLVVCAVSDGAVAAVDLVLGVAVVGGDQQAAVRRVDGARDPAEARVDALDGAHRRVEIAGVPDHVGVRVVGDDQRVDALLAAAATTASVTPAALISGTVS